MGCGVLGSDRFSAATSKVGDIFSVCHKITQKSDTGCDTTMTRAEYRVFLHPHLSVRGELQLLITETSECSNE